MKRIFAGCFGALLISSFISVETLEAKSVTFAYQTPTLSATLPIVVGLHFGFFASEGLEVKPVFVRGGPTAVAALIGGNVDYTLVAGVPAVRAIAQGAPLMIVGGIQPYVDYTLIGAKGIANLVDLKGKIVGVTGAGGIAEFAAVEGLAKKGLVRDLELTLMLADYHRTRPLLSGEVSADRIQLSPRPAVPGEACLRPVYEEFDIAEMSLSWYVMARCRGEPVIALPVFPMRRGPAHQARL